MSQIICSCGKKVATIHITELINGEKKEIHLCEDCAKKKKIFYPSISSLNELLSGFIEAAGGSDNEELNAATCPVCGMTFAEFRANSRFGCPNDYDVFREAVDPLLERMHGTAEHRGKKAGNPATRRSHQRLAELRGALKKAVSDEAYERAARLRDQIYALKKELGDAAD